MGHIRRAQGRPTTNCAHFFVDKKSQQRVIRWRSDDLRHFYASGLIASSCDMVAVQRTLGHATSTTYAHLWPSAEDRVRDASARLVAEVVGFY